MRRLVAGVLLVALAVAAFLLWRGPVPRHAGRETRSEGAPASPPAPLPGGEKAEHAGAAPEADGKARAETGSAAVPGSADATLVVFVTDEKGRPRTGAHVQVVHTIDGRSRLGQEAATDAQGLVRLAVQTGVRGSVTTRVGSFSRWLPLQAARKGETKKTVVMRSGGRVTGSIRHATKGPLEDVRVLAEPEQHSQDEWIEARSDAEGRFALEPVPAGSWKITLASRDVHLKEYIAVKLGPGGSADVGVVEVGGAAIEGLVRDEATSEPLAGATVTLQDPVYMETTTDRQGRFRFEDLTPCLHDIAFSRRGYALRHATDVEVKAGERTVLTVDLTPGAALDVYVRDTEGRPFVGPGHLSYTARGRSGGADLFFDENGHASCTTVPPGKYMLDISGPTVEGVPASVEIAPGPNTVHFRVTRRPASRGGIRSLHGTARDAATGAPLPGVRVWAQGCGTIYTDERGEYVLAGLEPGPCRAYAGGRDGYADRWLEKVTIVAGEERRLDFTLEPAATLRLRIKDKEGLPVTGEGMFIFVQLDGDRATSQGGFFADEQGCATIRRLRPGTHRLTISIPGIGGADPKTTIVAGENEIEITLR